MPDKWDEPRYAKYGEQYKLPKIEQGEHIARWLNDAGWFTSTGMGITALASSELRAWTEITGTDVTGVEASLMRRISRIYVSQHSESKDPKCPPPVHVEMNREEVVKGFKKWFGKLSNKGR